jgi:hypothetical protein
MSKKVALHKSATRWKSLTTEYVKIELTTRLGHVVTSL